MADLVIKIKCGRCGGAGTDDNRRDINGSIIPESCTSCSGTGYSTSGIIDVTDIIDLLNDIKDKTDDIFEKVSE